MKAFLTGYDENDVPAYKAEIGEKFYAEIGLCIEPISSYDCRFIVPKEAFEYMEKFGLPKHDGYLNYFFEVDHY
jgi:hypothetical protein